MAAAHFNRSESDYSGIGGATFAWYVAASHSPSCVTNIVKKPFVGMPSALAETVQVPSATTRVSFTTCRDVRSIVAVAELSESLRHAKNYSGRFGLISVRHIWATGLPS